MKEREMGDESKTAEKVSFVVPFVAANANSWGPPSDNTHPTQLTKFHQLPYAPFGRSDRIGRVADVSGSSSLPPTRSFGRKYENAEFQYKVQEQDFELVDNTATKTNSSVQPSKLRQLNSRHNSGRNQSSSHQTLRSHHKSSSTGGRGGRGGSGRGGSGRGGRGGGRGGTGNRNWRERVDRQASVSVKPDWNLLMDFDLNKLTKIHVTDTSLPKNEEDLLWCGFLDPYNEIYDKCSARTPAPLKRCEHKEFYPVTTTDDPVIENLATSNTNSVLYTTDAILSHVMTCFRSNYPWDIVIQKLSNGCMFWDKRDSSQFDYLTVHETAAVSPDAIQEDHTPERLSLEATMIHQNFSQQILKKTPRHHFEHENPFYDAEDSPTEQPASVAYRYRQFDLGGTTNVICRTELHGYVPHKSKKNDLSTKMTAFALNEYATAGKAAWKDVIDSQRGTVLANELKNNAHKIAKWTAQSLLAGADLMKIGYVSKQHQILATTSHRPQDFAAQITLSEGSMWGIVRMLIDFFAGQPEGKYVLMKHPNRALLRIYAVPSHTFEEEDGDDEEEPTAEN